MSEIVFVDCFDTIIYRKVPAQMVKYLFVEKLVNNNIVNMQASVAYRSYVSAEARMVNLAKKEYCESEYNINELFSLWYDMLKIYDYTLNDTKDVFIDKLRDMYIQVEKSVVYVNKKMIKYLTRKKANGSKIIMISDFYCGKEILNQLLETVGVLQLFDDVYVSCDYRLSKRTGSLYNYVIKNLNVNVSNVIMIGDNVHSDVDVPRSLGIKAIRVKERKSALPYKLKKKIYYDSNFFSGCKINKDVIKIFKSGNLDLSNYAFSLVWFTKALVEELNLKNKNKVYFLSREGQILKILFDNYCAEHNICIKSYYLEVSRNSVLKASLKDLDNEDFYALISQRKDLSVCDFLKTLDFGDADIKSIKEELSFDIDEKLTNFGKSSQFNELKNNLTFKSIYDELRISQRAEFEKYLERFDLDDDISIVDVGWKGTMQDYLFKFFGGEKTITGYYIGYTGEKGELSIKNKKIGLLYSNTPIIPQIHDEIFGFDIYNYEQILRADHNRVVAYKNGEAVFDDEANENEVYELLVKNLREEIIWKFNKLLKYEFAKNQILKMHFKMFMKMKYNDFVWLNNALNSHVDNFATIGISYDLKNNKKEYLKFKIKKLKFYLKNTILKCKQINGKV